MTQVRSSFAIPVPPEAAFGFVAEPKNFTVMWPAMAAVYGEQPSPAGGLDWRWEYRMLGIKLQGVTRVLVYEPAARISMLSEGSGLRVAHTWQFARVAAGTQLDLSMEFTLPAQWLTGVMEPLLVRENRQQAAIAMRNLRNALAAPEPARDDPWRRGR